jgi:hypothetical protein
LEARRHQREAERQHRCEVRRQQGWKQLALQREMRKEQQRQDEVYERWRLAEMQLRLRRQEMEHHRRREELKQQLRQEAAAGIDDGGAVERAGGPAAD